MTNAGLPRLIGTCSGWWKTKFPATLMVFGVGFKWGPHHATSHLQNQLESQQQSVPGCAEECGDPLVQSDPGCRSRTWRRPTSPKRPRLGFRRSATTTVPFSHWPSFFPDLNPLDYFVWSYVENITNMTSHHPEASLIAAIRRVFA